MPPRGLAEPVHHRAVHLGGVVQLALVPPQVQEHLRKGHQSGAPGGGLLHQPQGFGQVGLEVAGGGHLGQGDAGRRHEGLLSRLSDSTGTLARMRSRLAGVEVMVRWMPSSS